MLSLVAKHATREVMSLPKPNPVGISSQAKEGLAAGFLDSRFTAVQSIENEGFLVRLHPFAGRFTAGQYLSLDALSRRHGGASLRLTAEQGIEIHVEETHNAASNRLSINTALRVNFGLAGQAGRQVSVTPAPRADLPHRQLHEEAARLAALLAEGEESPESAPRVALILPADNTADVLGADLGFIALVEAAEIRGWQVVAGGGEGRLAQPLCRIGAGEAPELLCTMLRLARAHGGIGPMIEARGLPWLLVRLSALFGRVLAGPGSRLPLRLPELLGWHAQGDGLAWLGLPIAGGLIEDGEAKLATALRILVARFGASPIVTPQRHLLLADLPEASRPAIEALLREHGVRLAAALSPLRRWATAEPRHEPVIEAVELHLERLGLADERIALRFADRPLAGDIVLTPGAEGRHLLHLGGDFGGMRLCFPIAETADVARDLAPILAAWKRERGFGESFGDFCHRRGAEALRALLPGGASRHGSRCHSGDDRAFA